MYDTKLLGYIRSEFDKLRVDQKEFLANGGAKDFAEYRHVCGIIRGLSYADEFVKDLVQKVETDD